METKVSVELTPLVCKNCGTAYAVSSLYLAGRERNHKTWYCPNGHPWHYPQESEEEGLRRLLLKEQQRVSELKGRNGELVRQCDGALERLNKVTKRIDAGICPHCQRHFVNVERHINSKHKGEG